MAKERSPLMSKVKGLPDSPGVYLFINGKGEVIYVGKAARLKRRVASYFRAGRARDNRMELLASEIHDLKTIPASSEEDALICEAGLIKDLRPRFNVELKDDKSYPFLKLTINERYARLFSTRTRRNDGAVYYGPYVNAGYLKEAVSFMKKAFPLRTCVRLKKKVCLEYHIGQCAGPCEGKIREEDYKRIAGQARAFLEGRNDDLMRSLRNDMKRFSAAKNYEKALIVKKRIEALTALRNSHDRAGHPVYGELEELAHTLGLGEVPSEIECFDVSNTGSSGAVAAMVRFVNTKPDKNGYRRFRIREVTGVDDYSMIREAVRRRYSRLAEEGRKIPDLVLIDGGRGHLSSARKELRKLGFRKVPIASIAKEFNHIHTGTKNVPIRLSPGSRVLSLIQRIRDEAHRFAVTYHRKVRGKNVFATPLRSVKGIGPVRERRLMEKFGNIGSLKRASLRKIMEAGIDRRTAEKVVKYLNGTAEGGRGT